MNIVWQRPDGSIAITILVSATDPVAEATKLKQRGDIPATWTQLAINQTLPTDRSYRNAWTFSAGNFGHNMVKARDIHRDKIRAARKPLLEALDVEYQKADETGNQTLKQQIAQQKQALRNAPQDPRIEAAQTIAELKGVWPL
jgi:ABC-type phosphonate transport system ATPase subunit